MGYRENPLSCVVLVLAGFVLCTSKAHADDMWLAVKMAARFEISQNVAEGLCRDMADWRRLKSPETTLAEMKRANADVVPYLIYLLDHAPLRIDIQGHEFRLLRSSVRHYLALTGDSRASDAIVKNVRRLFPKTIASRRDDLCVIRMLSCLGLSRGDKALDLLFELQSKDFWDGPKAPVVDRHYLAEYPDDRWLEASRGVIRRYRWAAIHALAESGTERALRSLGTGEGLAADDIHYSATAGGSQSDFALVVAKHLGYSEVPYKETITPEMMEKILAIYRQYGKEYRPLVRRPEDAELCITPAPPAKDEE